MRIPLQQAFYYHGILCLSGEDLFPDFMDGNMERDACTLEQKVLFFSEDGLSFKFVHRHLKSLTYFYVLDDFSR